jgi:hypothetical protein
MWCSGEMLFLESSNQHSNRIETRQFEQSNLVRVHGRSFKWIGPVEALVPVFSVRATGPVRF